MLQSALMAANRDTKALQPRYDKNEDGQRVIEPYVSARSCETLANVDVKPQCKQYPEP